ncbi:MAG: right-handed parallel beta-helix repeat-containing protein [Elusimicrobia bacterium]|nr:right-handed parallel beta-helix repeat-containing protein [Elusimicrobiota bacterium]
MVTAIGDPLMAEIESPEGVVTADLVVSGLKPNTEYLVTKDDISISTVITDNSGKTSFIYPVNKRHVLRIKPKKNTIIINPDGSVTPPGALTVSGNIYYFPGDITDSIVIKKPSVILDGNGYLLIDPGAGWSGIQSWVGYVTMRNLNIKGFESGIVVYSSDYSVVENSTITAREIGLAVFEGEGITVRNNVFKGHTHYHVLAWSGRNNVFSNNYLGPPASTATTIGFYSSYSGGRYGRYNVFEKNTIDSAYIGFLVYYGWDYKIRENRYIVDTIGCPYPRMFNTQTFLIVRDYDTLAGPAVIVTSNTLNGYRYYSACGVFPRGYYSQNSPDNIVSGNIFNLTGDGLIASGGGNDTVSQNYFYSNTGIYSLSSSQKIIGNTMFENYNSAISVESAGNLISSNTITNTVFYGIRASGPNNTISTNTVSGNSYGIMLESGNIVFGNTLSNNAVGVRLYNPVNPLYSPAGNTVYHNSFINNTSHVSIEAPIPRPNSWNLPYPEGGNYYSDYIAPDNYFGILQNQEGSDRIVDIKKVFNSVNIDTYPFTTPNRWQIPDRIPPGKAQNVEVKPNIKENRIEVTWTNPTGDSNCSTCIDPNGKADVRLSTVPILTNLDFESLTLKQSTYPLLLNGAETESILIPAVMNTSYYGGVRIEDGSGNISYVSASAKSAGIFQANSPDGVFSIISHTPIISVSSALTGNAGLILQYAKESLNLEPASNVYQIFPPDIPFIPDAKITFSFEPTTVDTTTLAIYRCILGASGVYCESVLVTNQEIDLISNTINGYTSFASYFVLLFKPKIPEIKVSLDINPDTLNLKSQGQYITTYFEVVGAKTAQDIAPASIKIISANEVLLSTPICLIQEEAGKSGQIKFGTIGDYDLDGISDLMVKFDRQEIISVLPAAEQVKIIVQGSFKEGEIFTAEGYIRTILPGNIPANLGGDIIHLSKAKINIPENAVSLDADIAILKISKEPKEKEQEKQKSADINLAKRIGSAYEFWPEGLKFAKPVQITLPYDNPGIPFEEENRLRIGYWNSDAKNWEILNSIIDKANKAVTVQITHFSIYQILMVQEKPLEVPANFELGEVYAFPNPAKRGINPTLHIEAGIADKIEINIYDITGQLIKSVTLTGNPQLIDDGQGAQYAYEWTWDVSNAGSGIYIYAVKAYKNTGTLKAVKKLGIIK